MNLNHFTGKSCSSRSAADFFKTYSPGSGGHGEAKELEVWLGCPDLEMFYEHKCGSMRRDTGIDCTEFQLGYEQKSDLVCDHWKL